MIARKKPVLIDFYPCEEKYLNDIMKWSTKERPIKAKYSGNGTFLSLNIHTLEGHHSGSCIDMIIKGVNGEVYPCKKDIFEKTYEIIK